MSNRGMGTPSAHNSIQPILPRSNLRRFAVFITRLFAIGRYQSAQFTMPPSSESSPWGETLRRVSNHPTGKPAADLWFLHDIKMSRLSTEGNATKFDS